MMSEQELFDAIDGLMAYDHGALDSGIHDERLRSQVREDLKTLATAELRHCELYSRSFNAVMARYMWQYFLNPAAVAKGYGVEDVKSFIEWLEALLDG
jgi:hypothetical protein